MKNNIMLGQQNWWNIRQDLEYRPEWGSYRKNQKIERHDSLVWIPATIRYDKITVDEIRKLTEWCKENIDNVWEGPIGYLGVWKFRFTNQNDYLAFKLRH